MSKLKFKNDYKYHGDSRYQKVYEQMQLLGIQDVTTSRQNDNGTIVWKLPIKNWNSGKTNIEVASFSTGYVRNQNSGYSNYQLNKTYFEDEYFKDYDWNENYTKQTWNGKYRKFNSKKRVLIPIEIDRLEYLISYCLKNYYIKNANRVPNGEYVPEWKYDNACRNGHDMLHEQKQYENQRVRDLENKFAKKLDVNSVIVNVNGHNYKVI